ncbi:MAG: hypothetical protein KKG93_18605, partial [Bacteroidetes bacterium]|nr:hypothetical protein [Bacteroidota bacterium]
MKIKTLFLLLSFFLMSFQLVPSDSEKKFNKVLKDDNSKYTSAGNIGMTITNFGTLGHGFSLWPEQPSCEYPIGSGIEHLFDGGLWIGGFLSDNAQGSNKRGPFVTTASVDASSVSNRGGGFEFTNRPESKIIERSSLIDSKFFSPLAVSHQDFVCDFVDTNRTLENNELIVDHSPLGVAVRLESY